EGQLDESNLTLNDLKMIRTIFVDILQSMFHPRINYRDAVAKKAEAAPKPAIKPKTKTTETVSNNGAAKEDTKPKAPSKQTTAEMPAQKVVKTMTSTEELSIADEEPMSEVPRLPSLDERKNTGTFKSLN